ncbi:MAG: hypothetical protein M1839_006238 [Geoglossum umbratile]|nr:MAG: hypothetical protein M1839_006238 [Geoglossum umbratile]
MIPQIGDFIAMATLATKAFQALDSSRGSKFEFNSLLDTLKALGQAMWQAEALCMECHTTLFSNMSKDPRRLQLLESIAGDISKEREHCEALITHFLKGFSSYTRSFSEGDIGKVRLGIKKLTWAGRKDEVAVLEKRLNAHLQALQIYLWNFSHATMEGSTADNRALLGSIDSSVGTLASGFSDVRHQMSEALTKLDMVQKSMPTAVGYCWGPEPPILLLDGLGRKTSLPMMLVCSPDIFREILLIMHRGGPGYDKIQGGKYVVSDEDSGGALVPRDKWLDRIQPGKRIGLSFLLKHPGARDEKQCPRCKTLETWFDDHPGQRRCLKCHLTFKVEDQERTRRFWKDLKTRPKRPKPPDSDGPSSTSKPAKSRDTPGEKPLRRTGTLDPDEYDHPYLRVHYQRDVPSRAAAEQPWEKSDPEFEGFLAALPPMHSAAATGSVEKLDELLESGGDSDMGWEATDSLYRHDRTGWDFAGAPPIHFAAYYGHNQAVLFLLSCGADIEGKDAAGTTALHAAAWTGNEKLFKLLLKKGADRTTCDYDGWSVAIYAMNQGHDNISRLLLEGGGGDIETLVKTYTLRHAAKLGNMDAVLGMLLEDQAAGGDSEARDMLFGEALIGAAEGGHDELTRRLLDAGADATAQDNSGSTALHWAAWGGHTEIENLRYDEKGEAGDGEDDTPPPPRPTSHGHESVIQMLLDRGADINAQNSQGCTPLHWVAGAGSAPMIQCFMDNGALADIMDNCGRTAVDRAVETKDEDVIRQLGGA